MVNRFVNYRTLAALGLALFSAAFAFADHPAATDTDLEAKFKAKIAAFREKQKKGSMVVAVLHPKGDLFDASGNIKGKDQDPAPTRTTPFEIGSITKVFTGILLSEAVERGELRLDDTLSKILPDWKFPEFDTRQMTPLDLTTHTSGLPPVPLEVTGRAVLPWLDPYATYTVDKLKNDMGTTKLTRPPGAIHAYSNLGVGLLGTTLTLRAKKAHFNDLVKERILDPWGMKQTVPNTREMPLRPTAFDSSGIPTKGWTFDALSGAGSLASTTEDMLIFSRKFFEPGEKKTVLDRVKVKWREIPTVDSGSFQTKAVGLGAFQARRKGMDETVYWHNGGTGGFSSFWAVVPERKIAVLVLASVSDRKIDRMGFDILLDGLSAK